MKKPSNDPEQPDLEDAPFRLPDRKRADWMPEPLEVIESIVDDLRQLTRELLHELDHDRERAFDLVRASSELYRHAEEMLQMVRDATESPDEFLAIGQLTYRFEQALSYFVASNGACPEDKGFAIKGWTAVRFENVDIVTEGPTAMAMGNYFFTDPDGKEVKVEYSFGYLLDDEGNVRIVLHHSSMPYAP